MPKTENLSLCLVLLASAIAFAHGTSRVIPEIHVRAVRSVGSQVCNKFETTTGPDNSIEKVNDILKEEQSLSKNISKWKAEGVGTTLRQVFFIHRHGDRTPTEFPPKDNLLSEPFWDLYGLGQLINKGRIRLYMLGDIIRMRYDGFVQTIQRDQRVSRSSGIPRCIESSQLVLAAILQNDLPQCKDMKMLAYEQETNRLGISWLAAGVLIVPKRLDGMLFEGVDCKALKDEYSQVIENLPQIKQINIDYKVEADTMNKSYGLPTKVFADWSDNASQLQNERIFFEKKMRPEILAIYDRVQKAGVLGMAGHHATSKAKRLRSGLLVNEIITRMKRHRDVYPTANKNSKSLKKLLQYTTHDLNLGVLLGVLGAWEKFPQRPEYASNVIMELHQDKSDWFVKVFWMATVPSEPVEITNLLCKDSKGRCSLEKFESSLNPYRISSWQAWMKECNNDLNLIDMFPMDD